MQRSLPTWRSRWQSSLKIALRVDFSSQNKRPAGETCEPFGGLLGIDQEVVTLRGLYGYSGLLTDLGQAESILNHR